jgi:hypothetical protein
MTGIIILIISLILLLIAFVTCTSPREKLEGNNIPPEVQLAFRVFAEELVKPLGIGVEESEIAHLELLSEVPFEDGTFQYHSFEYGIIPSKPVENEQGIVLNSQEIMEKAGMSGNPVLLYFKRANQICEISLLQDNKVAEYGYKGYIDNRYGHMKDWEIIEEYSLTIDEKKYSLWENLNGIPPFDESEKTRERTQPPLSYSAQYIDTWKADEVEIQAMIFFEKKKELVYSIKTTNSRAQTSRGISVGCSVDELKEKYPKFLAYNDFFMEKGSCYGFIPRDNTTRYIAFFTEKKRVSEIWIVDAFDERGFEEQTGYVDEDVEWVEYEYSEKLTEKYAREIYLGKHQDEYDPWQVFHNYIIHDIEATEIIDKGLWRSSEDEMTYYLVYRKTEAGSPIAVEVRMKKIKLDKTTNDAKIWVVTKHRSQKN